MFAQTHAQTCQYFSFFGFGFLGRSASSEKRLFGRRTAVATAANARLEGDWSVGNAFALAFTFTFWLWFFRG